MTIEDFAEELGVSIRAVAYWRQRSDMVQKPERQAILDTVLERAPDSVKARFGILISEEFGSTAGGILGADRRAGTALISHVGNFGDASEADARSVLAWLESTNTSDDVINYFARTVAGAAEDHASTPPTALLSRVHQLHSMIRALLQNGRQRQRQTADLLRLDADLLAHLCQLLGDVHRDRAAAAYAKASIALAYEAGSESAAAFSAQAQIARWRGHFSEAADLAERGVRSGAPAPLRMLLAYQEASSAAAAGDARRARTVLDAADAMDNSSLSYAAWSCPPARRALFRMGVAVSLGEPDAALRQAAEAEPIWVHERARAFGTWAHFRITAATAHIMLASPEGAIQEVEPVLELPHEYRISTVVEHLAALDKLLLEQPFGRSPEVGSLREEIRQFTSDKAVQNALEET